MTTELEKQFFDTFGIVPNNNKCELAYCAKNLNCKDLQKLKAENEELKKEVQYLKSEVERISE